MKPSFKILMLALVQALAQTSLARADVVGADYTNPYINPQRDCLTEGMINPEGKQYRYLYSRDCRVVHVLPPAVLPQNIKARGVNLKACEGVNHARSTITTIEATIDEAYARLRGYESALDEAGPAQARVLREKIEAQQKRLDGYEKNLSDAQARFQQDYAQMPGAKFSIAMDGDISSRDLNELRGLNLANLNRKKVVVERTVGPDGKESVRQYEVVEQSALRAAQVGQSYFSFIYNVPKDAGQNGGLISTDIPALQYLEQPDRSGVIHVKASGGISGLVIMSVTAACDHTKVGENGQLEIDEQTDPFFTVNRTFAVQQMFAQGYTAELNVDKAVEQITNYVTTHTNQGFKKSSVFTPILNAKVDELMTFKWMEDFEDGKNVSLTDVLEIKKLVAAKLIDDYIEKLKRQDLVTVVPDKKTDAAQGGYVDETRVANRCWTERDGGLSGVFGGRHTVCGDYTYTVKVWQDGVTSENIRRSLTLNGTTTDTMLINSMTPFYFTTAFTK